MQQESLKELPGHGDFDLFVEPQIRPPLSVIMVMIIIGGLALILSPITDHFRSDHSASIH